ncbi:very short patch repair endonuclease [Massilia psychrophila]|nr:very short patch repair endonuclease [Massilia psychrophila]
MRAIRSKNTVPELLIRKLLFSLGFRFRLHVKSLPGTPDIVLPKYRTAIFVHGCFWHGHDCHLFTLPQTRRDFWQAKIDANRQRDLRSEDMLISAGWHVLSVWECALKGRLKQEPDELAHQLTSLIRHNYPDVFRAEIRHR